MVSTFTGASDVSINTVEDMTLDPTAETAKKTVREIAQQMSHDCVARRLRQVNRTLTRLYDEALRPYGLTINQLNILAVIVSEKQIQPGQLGQALGMEKSTVSRTIDRMAKKNWLQIASGKDSRTQLLSVTPKGRQLLLAVAPIWNTLQQSVLSSRNDQNILDMLALDTAPTQSSQTERQDREVPLSADDFYL
ncbi:transcriptional regulator, MarR family [Synechococcus sp. PCC 7335]|nr:transcriptional regulator, MarR family [Synechococcus sp. PCC 7335]